MTNCSWWLKKQSHTPSVGSELVEVMPVDMIFCVRWLVDKAIEHNTKLFCYLLTNTNCMILYPEQPFGVLCRSMVYLVS